MADMGPRFPSSADSPSLEERRKLVAGIGGTTGAFASAELPEFEKCLDGLCL